MPSIHGGLSEAELEAFEEHMIGRDGADTQSEAIRNAILYTLYNKYDVEPDSDE